MTGSSRIRSRSALFSGRSQIVLTVFVIVIGVFIMGVLSSVGVSSEHVDFTDDEITYRVTSEADRTVEVRHYSGLSPKLVIPTKVTYEGTEYSVTGIAQYALSENLIITSVTIPDSVTDIEYGAFEGSFELLEFDIDPGNPCYCDKDGVLFDKGLEHLIQYPYGRVGPYSIPDGVVSIGHCAFFECAGLTSVTIPDSVTDIEPEAFSSCTGLTSVRLPDSLTCIRENMFFGCIGLTSLTIPEGVTIIGQAAFNGCTGLTSLTIPDGVSGFGQHAFAGCTGLTSLVIPGTVTEIGYNAFNGCTGLTSLTIPDGVSRIESNTFYGCTGLKSVIMPGSITYIGLSVFYGCTGLTTLTLPDGITTVEPNTFYGCTGLTSLTLPMGVTNLGKNAFRGCTGLESMDIPSHVTEIGQDAFRGCTQLTSMTIPDSVTEIGLDAFRGCIGLEQFVVGAGNPHYKGMGGVLFDKEGNTLIRCPQMRAGPYEVPNSVTRIMQHAFEGCTGITSMTIPDSVRDIESDAFRGCTGLVQFVVGAGNPYYKDMGDVLFDRSGERLIQYPCGKAGSYEIPPSVIVIDDHAFEGATGLTSVSIPATVAYGDFIVFSGCESLTSITVADGFHGGEVISVGGVLFDRESVTLIRCPEGKTGRLSLPDSVTSIGSAALSSSQLSEIAIRNGSTILVEHDAFRDCNPDLRFVSERTGFDLEIYKDVERTAPVTIEDLSANMVGTMYLKWVRSPDTPSSDPSSGANTGLVIGVAIGAIVIAGAGVLLFMRRRA